ncbi:hypothetical protein N180_19770 [Pedobacter antarcticus 4BY]|jgi:hypothetical protein|uniref:Uncharacterized protein n=2 Tax=Pedobacter antarcticus TaxID=34086 RepID=A0A081PDN3_9SPHI|nr:hypothetical protein [Pedobacter antarcticus]KEQ28806.1 hypothetical protein N180_19770 [Pedobacter antarcticus 4BY]SFF42933.1 hypothetical protein SAMN03003324_03816 [Pedobacter antarcticus]
MKRENSKHEASLKNKLTTIGEPIEDHTLSVELTKGEAAEYGIDQNDILSPEHQMIESEGEDVG